MTGRVCTVPNCDRPTATARGKYCAPHRADYLAHRAEITTRTKETR